MGDIRWDSPEAIQTALSTELNSLADGSLSTASGAIDNLTDLYPFIELELFLASLTPSGSPYCALYLLPQIDGTNYADASTSMAELLATFNLSTSAGTKRVLRSSIAIPPFSFKLALLNEANVALAASGNTVKYRRFGLNAA